MSGPCFSASVGDHPLRPPTRRRLGEPLPHQPADGTQVPPKVDCSFIHGSLTPVNTWGISSPFELLSPASGQVTHVLLTRSPLTTSLLSVRLTCIRHAASVHPEPGSNSPQKIRYRYRFLRSLELSGCSPLGVPTQVLSFLPYHSSVVKVLFLERAGLYHPPGGLSRLVRDQKPMSV